MRAEMERYAVMPMYNPPAEYQVWERPFKVLPEALCKGTREQCETWRYERAFAAGQEAMWQDIATTPEDKHVLLATSGGWVGEAIRLSHPNDPEDDIWEWASGHRVAFEHKPLGWQPLPPPPTGNGEGES